MQPFGVVTLSPRWGQPGVLASLGEGRVTPGYTKLDGKAMHFLCA